MFSLARLLTTAFAVSTLVSALPAVDLAERDSGLEARKPKLAEIIKKCTKKNVVALTFNDGPSDVTDHIVQVLARFDAKATFFVHGHDDNIYNDDNADLIRKAYKAGHQIASKGFKNKDFTSQSESELKDDLDKLDDALKSIIGVVPRFVRPPEGRYNDKVREVVYKNGQKIVLWDFNSGDADGLSTDESQKRYQELADKKPKNALALNHEVSGTAFQVLPFALKALSEKKYKFVTVAECIGEKPYQ
ncbi:Carbohydrate esterase 4 protein [Tulasnella sp. 403]|nr:Carbohydrate esterase 4 protein [Tulasnella sp. 403]